MVHKRKDAKRRVRIKADKPKPAPVLFTEEETRHILGGINRTSFWKLEKAGVIKAHRLNPRVLGRKYYRAEDIYRLAGVSDVTAATEAARALQGAANEHAA
jgi:hypothetical protein